MKEIIVRKMLWTLVLVAPPALAELPALTPSQQAQEDKKSAAEQAMLEKQMQALAEAQLRVARQYRSTHPKAPAGMSIAEVQEPVEKGDIPKSATQPLAKKAEPHTPQETMPQAEAHSRDAQ